MSEPEDKPFDDGWDTACHYCGQMKCGCSRQDRQGTGAGPYRQPASRNRAGDAVEKE